MQTLIFAALWILFSGLFAQDTSDQPVCYLYDIEITGTADESQFNIDGRIALVLETANPVTTNDLNLFEVWLSAGGAMSVGQRGSITLMTNSAYYAPGRIRQERHDMTNINMRGDLTEFEIEMLPETADFQINGFAVSRFLIYAVSEGKLTFSFTDMSAEEIIGTIDVTGTSWTSDETAVYRANFEGTSVGLSDSCDLPST